MDPVEIKHALELAGSSQTEIARKCRVTPAMVHLVIFHGAISGHIHRAIAEAIGVQVEAVWPEYYMKKAAICGDDCVIRAALLPEFDVMDEAGRTIYAYGEMVLEDKIRGKKRKTLEDRAIEIKRLREG